MDRTLLATNARRILILAITSEHGIRVKAQAPNTISPAVRARTVLYRFKNEDPQFKNITIRLDPDEPNHFLWVIRTDTGFVAPVGDTNDPDEFKETKEPIPDLIDVKISL